MFGLRNNKNKKQFSLQDIETISTSGIRGTDRNNDGVPDYLQRGDLVSIAKSNKDLNQWEVDTSMEIEKFTMNLRGYSYDPESLKYKPFSPPVMNEIGIVKVQGHLESFANKHNINSSISNEDAHNLTLFHLNSLIKWFKYNCKKCDATISDLTTVMTSVNSLMWATISRAIGDGQRKHTTDRTRLTGSVGNDHKPEAAFP